MDEAGETIASKLESDREVGTDEDGDTIRPALWFETDQRRQPQTAKGPRLTPNQSTMLDYSHPRQQAAKRARNGLTKRKRQD